MSLVINPVGHRFHRIETMITGAATNPQYHISEYAPPLVIWTNAKILNYAIFPVHCENSVLLSHFIHNEIVWVKKNNFLNSSKNNRRLWDFYFVLIKKWSESILIKECSLKSHWPMRVSNRTPIGRSTPTWPTSEGRANLNSDYVFTCRRLLNFFSKIFL